MCAEYTRHGQQKRPRRVFFAALVRQFHVFSLAWLKSESEHRFRFARLRCAISRILSWAAMCLGSPLPTTSGGTFVGPNWFPTNTALHRGKNFAVSSPCCHEGHPNRMHRPFGVSVSVRISRLAADGRYPLPFSIERACVRTFLSFLRRSDCLAQTDKIPRTRNYGNVALLPTVMS